MQNFISFDTFWDLAIKKLLHCNALSYHPCCDTWSTRFSKSKSSHYGLITWKELIQPLDRSKNDKKQAFRAMMEEKAMNTAVVLNKPCSKTQTNEIAFKIQNSENNNEIDFDASEKKMLTKRQPHITSEPSI